jgi:hypothetical protein
VDLDEAGFGFGNSFWGLRWRVGWQDGGFG